MTRRRPTSRTSRRSWGCCGRKENNRNSLSHRGIPGRRRMQVVSRIKLRQQAIGIHWIAQNIVEINNGIKMTGGTNPLVDGLPVRLALRPWMIESRARKGQYGAAGNLDSVAMGTKDNLLVPPNDVVDQFVMASGTS